jgi:hypothetical protein
LPLPNLRAVYYSNDRANVTTEYKDDDNHEIGSIEDIQYLSLSLAEKKEIEERIRESYT